MATRIWRQPRWNCAADSSNRPARRTVVRNPLTCAAGTRASARCSAALASMPAHRSRFPGEGSINSSQAASNSRCATAHGSVTALTLSSPSGQRFRDHGSAGCLGVPLVLSRPILRRQLRYFAGTVRAERRQCSREAPQGAREFHSIASGISRRAAYPGSAFPIRALRFLCTPCFGRRSG